MDKNEQLRNLQLDLDRQLHMAEAIAHNEFPKQYLEGISDTPELPFRETMIGIAAEHLKSNFRVIHDHAESPIETIFLGCLHMKFMAGDVLSVNFTPPIDLNTYPDLFRSDHEATMKMWDQFTGNRGGEIDIFGFEEALKQRTHIDEGTLHLAMNHVFLYHLLGLYNKYQISLQPTLRLDDKNSIRPDVYAWVPARPEIKIIIECDGFKYHSSKSSFSRDRARDRMLQIQGFQVFRFAGSEIYHNSLETSSELYRYLISLMS